MINRIGVCVTATVALLLSVSSAPRALAVEDAVLEWNQIALAATTTAGQGPLPQSRSMTIVQVSVHDAVNAITGKHKPIFPTRPRPLGLRGSGGDRRRAPRARDAVPAAGDGAGCGARRVPRGTGPDRGRSGHPAGEKALRPQSSRLARNDGAAQAQFAVHRARRRHAGRLGGDRRRPAAAAGLGQRDAVGPPQRLAVPSRRTARRSTAGAGRVTTTKFRQLGR